MLHTAIRSALATLALALVACGGTASTGYPAAPAPMPSPTQSPTPIVRTASATVAGQVQTILVDPGGLTLYYFTPDRAGTPTCVAACAAAWPPLVLPSTSKTATASPALSGTLDTVANPEGRGQQVRYNGWPLYTFAKDRAPGDTFGQGVAGKWFVATPTAAGAY